jgi:PAS domain S-box-containing protein
MDGKIEYDIIFKLAGCAMVIINQQGEVSRINKKSEKLLGLHSCNVLTNDIRQLIPAVTQPVTMFLQTQATVSDFALYHSTLRLNMDIVPIQDDTTFIGGICCFRKNSADITKVRKTTHQRILNQQLEAIFASSSDGIWVCDGDGQVIMLNKASEVLNGIQANKVVGHNIFDLLKTKVFDQSVTVKVLKNGRQETILQYISKTNKYLLSTGTPALDERGRISLIVVNERDMTELSTLKKKFEQSQKVKERFKEELSELALRKFQQSHFIADSPVMRNILQMSLKLAHIGASNILLLGESGTGKTMLSQLIHKNSNRRKNPFIEINCAALPESLLEAELFGYEKGAFTGADEKGKIGLFEMAQGGTLFLDEIGDMPLALQTKLLKYLDNHEIRRLGGTESIQVDCSIIAATNQDLMEMVQKKNFREDLFYRLNSFILKIPPLRERAEDIPNMVRMYLEKFNRKYSTEARISSRTMQSLLTYSFPGNIRELKNIVENGVALSENSQADEFIHISLGNIEISVVDNLPDIAESEDLNLQKHLQKQEKQLLQKAKQRFITTREMAKHLGISQPSVVRKLKLYKIH